LKSAQIRADCPEDMKPLLEETAKMLLPREKELTSTNKIKIEKICLLRAKIIMQQMELASNQLFDEAADSSVGANNPT
jgi:hypothetical protein